MNSRSKKGVFPADKWPDVVGFVLQLFCIHRFSSKYSGYDLMRCYTILLMMVFAALVSLGGIAQAATVFSDNFEAYAAGDLTGQGGWVVYDPGNPSLKVAGGGNPGNSAFSDTGRDTAPAFANAHPITLPADPLVTFTVQ